MKLIILSLLIAHCFAVNLQSQSRITTKSGNTFIGFIQSDNDIEIVLLSLNNEKVVIPMSSVIKQELLTLSVSTKSGLELSGTLTRISDDDFEIRTSDGILMTIRFDGVEKFKIDDLDLKKIIDRFILSNNNTYINQNDLKYRINGNINRINRNILHEEKKSDYYKLGVNIGTPAGINIIFGMTTSNLGFHISGGYWEEDVYGFQIGPGINLVSTESTEINMLVGYSVLKVIDVQFSSINLMLDVNVYGLHIEFGFGFGDGSVSSPQLLYQIGYAYRWRK